jgi:hypothetical protein
LIAIDERRAFQKILWKIPAKTQLGENSEVRPLLLGAFRQAQDTCGIACKVAYRGIKLREGYFH